MSYTPLEIMQYIEEEDVKFIRLAFCDIWGKQKNISIMPAGLERAFQSGIPINATVIDGFSDSVHSDLFLHPDPSTLNILPWRPDSGRVVRFFCSVTYRDGTPFEADTRTLLKKAVAFAKERGYLFEFGSKLEFYLFKTDDNGNPTDIPHDNATYMDIAPLDKGENIRREICLTLERMGITPESSHHEVGPGQNEIDFRNADPLKAADDAITFKMVVNTITDMNGLYADFSPVPILNKPGNAFHINFSVKGGDVMQQVIAGIMSKIPEMTMFLNPTEASYRRFGTSRAPRYVTWSSENRSQLIRIPASAENFSRAELRSPDPLANPYITFALLIYAGIYGIENNLTLPEPANAAMIEYGESSLKNVASLPVSLGMARENAIHSDFIARYIPGSIIKSYCGE